MSKITVGPAVVEPSAEKALREWFEAQRLKSIDNLEAGARQIISLVSLFYSVIFGALALGRDSLENSLHYRVVLVPGTIAVLSLLVAVVAALNVVLPLYRYQYNPHKPAEERAAFEKMLNRKLWGMRVAVGAFGVGIVAFALLVGMMLYYR